MGCGIEKLKLYKNNSAVSDIVSLILVVIIMVSTISVVLVWGVPEINKNKADNRAENVISQFNLIGDLIIDDVVGQGYNSSKKVKFSSDMGSITVSSSETRIVFYYSIKEGFDFNVTGLFDDDETKFEYYGDNADWLNVYFLFDENKAAVSKPVPPNPPPATNTVNLGANNPLTDAIMIDVVESDEIYGRIWLFDIGAITYLVNSQELYRASVESGAVISDNYIENLPNFYIEDNLFYMQLIDLENTDITSVSWGGIDQTPRSIGLNLEKLNKQSNLIKFTVENNETYIREDSRKIINNFKINISGNRKSENAWRNYFEQILDFNTFESGVAKDTLYRKKDDNFCFTFIQSTCDVYLEVS